MEFLLVLCLLIGVFFGWNWWDDNRYFRAIENPGYVSPVRIKLVALATAVLIRAS